MGLGCTQLLDVGLLLAHLLLQGSVLCLEALHLLPQVGDLEDRGHSSLGATAVKQMGLRQACGRKGQHQLYQASRPPYLLTPVCCRIKFCQPQQSC